MRILRLFLLLCCVCFSLPAQADGWPRLLKKAQKGKAAAARKIKAVSAPAASRGRRIKNNARLNRAITRRAVSTPKAVQAARLDSKAYMRLSQEAPFHQMAPVSAPAAVLKPLDPVFAAKNDALAWPWLSVVDKDLQFLQEYKADMLNVLKVSYLPIKGINYASLIPPTARKIYVGEEHWQPVIYEAFENLIFQYQKMYPQRQIIVLAEFVSDRLFPWQEPGRPVRMLEMPFRQNNATFSFFNRFVKKGIEVIGLEDVAYVQEHAEMITPFDNEAQSVKGMKERNEHWRNIIDRVAAQNPKAVLFIYAGSLHTHYRAPYSLANSSPQNFVLQLETNTLGKDIPFGFVMQHEPFVQSVPDKVTVLSWPKFSAYSTRSGFDACLLFTQPKLRD